MITEIIKKLKPFLTDNRQDVASKAAQSISTLQAKQYIKNAIKQYGALSEQVKTRILMEIPNIKPAEGVDFLNLAFNDELPQVRSVALRTAIELDDPKLIQKVATLVNDVDEVVRKLAYEFLGKFPIPQISSFLNKKLAHEKDKDALIALIDAIGNIGNQDSLNELFKIVDIYSKDEDILKKAIESIAKLKI